MSRFSDDERFAVALAIRDWIHEQPWSQCGPGVDLCPDWDVAYVIRDIALEPLERRSAPTPRQAARLAREAKQAHRHPVVRGEPVTIIGPKPAGWRGLGHDRGSILVRYPDGEEGCVDESDIDEAAGD